MKRTVGTGERGSTITTTSCQGSYPDHHLGMVDLKVDANILGSTVRVTATLGVRDWSGDWDDDYEGTVYFAVLAEL